MHGHSTLAGSPPSPPHYYRWHYTASGMPVAQASPPPAGQPPRRRPPTLPLVLPVSGSALEKKKKLKLKERPSL